MILKGTIERLAHLWEATAEADNADGMRLYSIAVARGTIDEAKAEIDTWAEENGHEIEWRKE